MEQDGLKMMSCFNTFIVDPSKLDAPPNYMEEKALHARRTAYFKEAVDNGFFL